MFDAWIVMLLLTALSLPILLIVLLISHLRHRGKVARMELRLATLETEVRDLRRLVGGAGESEAAEMRAEAETEAMADRPAPIRPRVLAENVSEETAGATPEIPAAPPWPVAARGEAQRPAPPSGPTMTERLMAWLRENWFYALSALSLALAGLFLVQYGVETGLLTPTMRIALAGLLGMALIAAGEAIRRRSGDGAETVTAYLPSTFSGAGIVTLYGAVLGARSLYGLIGPEAALAGLALVAAVALVFGWFYGPFIAAIGLVGGAAAPFLVGGHSDTPEIFYAYFGLLGLVGLAIDGVRRWRWLSPLALALSAGPAWLLFLNGAAFAGFAVQMLVLALAALCLPRMERWPSQDGDPLARVFFGAKTRMRPDFDTAIAGLGVAGATWLILANSRSGEADLLFAALILTLLLLALALWCHRAEALVDIAMIPGAAIVALAANAGDLVRLPVAPSAEGDPLLPLPRDVPELASALLVLATLGSLAYAWRSGRDGPWRPIWAAAAVILAPASAVAMEMFWPEAAIRNGLPWALHVIALAALMTLLAERWARADGPGDRRRMAYAVLSALSLIALALFILLSQTALTLALSILVAAAAALDRRFGLREMALFLAAGVAVLGYRLIADPGLPWAEYAPLGEVCLAFLSALAGLGTAWLLLAPRGRIRARTLLESAFWAYGGIFVSILLLRLVRILAGEPEQGSYWSVSLLAMVWLLLAAAQLRRLEPAGWMRKLRLAAASAYGALGSLLLLSAVFARSPLTDAGERIYGPWPLDTLLIAYGLPAAILLAAGRFLSDRRLRLGVRLAGAGLLAFWVGLEIRRFWLGGVHVDLGLSDPELYTYTVALLLLGAGLLYRAIATGDPRLRRAAVAVIALTVAKVFLLDASGLTGLLRVFSFLILGLVLAFLAWLNRWAAARADRMKDDAPEE